MKCFNHADRDAVGICKSCGRALCHECLVASPQGVVCKDENCGRVAMLCDRAVAGNLALLSTFKDEHKQLDVINVIMGVMLIVIGLVASGFSFAGPYWMIMLVGVLSIAQGLEMRRRKSQYTTPAAEAK